MNWKPTLIFAIFLVLLRLAIGWHFFIEGTIKVESFAHGVSLKEKPWSSAAYLNESSGPLADFFRAQGGDLDNAALARLLAPTSDPNDKSLPPALEKEWDAYFARFKAENNLSSDPTQLQLAEGKVKQAKERAAEWLRGRNPKDVYEIERPLTNTTVKLERTSRQRIEEYRDLVAQIHMIEQKELPSFAYPVRKDLPTLKAEARALRNELTKDLDKILTEPLDKLLTPEQTGKKKEREAERQVRPEIPWRDWIVAVGLVVVGAGLLLGFVTRIQCWLGAAFLLSVYLAMPPFPGVPENPKVEGHYLFVNKNLIEMLALLAISATPSGRWLGLDGLLYALNPFRKRPAADASTQAAAPAKI